jgi:hypothetical protein
MSGASPANGYWRTFLTAAEATSQTISTRPKLRNQTRNTHLFATHQAKQ